jgi:glycosyltransferase involved in cell wall biosynthesis
MESLRWKSFSEGKRTFLYLGLIKKQKGIYVLLSSFARVAYPHASLFIAGTGQEEARARRYASSDPRVTFSGYLEREALVRVFREIHFLVVPSLLYENSPMVVYESFASGIPAIVAESGGASELVFDGENGFVALAGDEPALLYALNRACRLDLKQYQHICVRARARIEDFGVADYCKKLLSERRDSTEE